MDLDGLDLGSTILTSGVFTVSLTATTIVSAAHGVFNVTASAFGINADGGGDDTDTFDAGGGTESMTFSFNINGTFVAADFNLITGSGLPTEDIGNLSFSLGGLSTNFHNANTDGSDVFLVNQAFSVGEEITIAHVDGNGFGLETITIDVVPEPTSVALLGMGAVSLCIFGRRRVRSPRQDLGS